MRAYGQFLFQLAIAKDLYPGRATVGQTHGPQDRFIHAGAVFKPVQRFNVHGSIAGCVARVVETALGNAADQWHLAAFKTDADGTTRPGGLAFATPPACLAVSAGFTLTETLTAMSGAG